MRLFTLFFILFTLSKLGLSQPCDTTALILHKVKAQTTDPNISFELANHHSFYNPLCTSKNTLLLYMVGTINNPANDLLFTKMAANNGFHVISLKYINNKSATTACANDNDTTCYENFHKESIFGTDLITAINVDTANSILNRTEKLLQYLTTNFSSENWGQYLNGNAIDWSKVIVAGHSQGSGQATYLGHLFPVQRVLMFGGPNEYMNNHKKIAPWFSVNNTTADSNYYSFGNTNDEISFTSQLLVWNKIGLNNHGDTINVNNYSCPYNNRRMLYTDNFYTGTITPNHNSVMVDDYTPIDGNGKPLYEDVWKYMLGICATPTSLQDYQTKNILVNIFPSPANEFITVSLEQEMKNVTISIHNILGKRLWNKNYNTLAKEKIELREIPSGIYLINISSDNFKTSKKIIIK